MILKEREEEESKEEIEGKKMVDGAQ